MAGAVLAISSAANAGIIIPAGDWTVDIGGNVNAYTSWRKLDGTSQINSSYGTAVGAGTHTKNGFGNGLLPNFLSVSGTTRQNDLDVSFTISLQPGTSAFTALNGGTGAVGGMTSGNGGINNRQAFLTFGDKSWGSIKAGKDLGIFASDAILSDMTLLGVGGAAVGTGNTSLGRIGFGYIYADWKPQIAYTTPNFNGAQATVGISQAFDSYSVLNNQTNSIIGALLGTNGKTSTLLNTASNASPAYEGKVSYAFAANDVTGKVWASGLAQRVTNGSYINDDKIAYVGDIGANINMAGFGLTGYYYSGSGVGTTGQMTDGYGLNGNHLGARDSDGGYVQATYTLPTKTKVGVSWGISNLDLASGESNSTSKGSGFFTTTVAGSGLLQKENEMWTVGVYHPLTKHLNLVAEYNYSTSTNQADQENKSYSGNLGAILFF